ncbi:putative acid phosphatase [Gordonia araii NBRC 100433]|uniref:phosphoserine phosphatase n=1 Tax=Gordonia araii NBRC 100433 TaxID=1073574 RepID=G7H687_9ACTN|nr:HAD family hydrolase [Gordonia araii]NNG96043.1 haloacid dehalogenase-like hydrolase [Gordonia araii NBRC 100433]GAB11362.1 putative acid phosphatase [Gordonia araii NBRC 100433]
MLESWNNGAAKAALVDFVEGSAQSVPVDERVAVFDNDGTLWCEKPAYIQLDYLVRRAADQVAADPSLATDPAYAAAQSGDLAWFGNAVEKHYNGDDSDLKTMAAALLKANAAATTDEFASRVAAFFADGTHPTLDRPYRACGYAPMIELLRYTEANGFTNYIVSGGGRDFMRPVTGELYGIPPERVVGSSVGVTYGDGDIAVTDKFEFMDDGPGKPVAIWSHIGRRPILAVGNSNGDLQMLEYATAGSRPSLGVLVRHDDPDREFDYIAGAEQALEQAAHRGWTVASIRDDWRTVFAGEAMPGAR